jgi:carboxyl-terminal processing protease
MFRGRLPRHVSSIVVAAVAVLMLLATLGGGLVLGAGYSQLVGAYVPLARSHRPEADAAERDTPAVFREAWRIIRDEFVDRSALDDRRLTYAAIRGLIQELNDPNTRFRTPEQRRVEAASYSGQLQGIGVYLDLRDGRLTVSAPIPDGPADEAGLRSGDVIVAVDGEPTAGWSLEDAVLRIRGPVGTGITLTIQRSNAAAPTDVTLARREVRLISTRAAMVEREVGLVRITSFTERTDDEVGAALDDLRGQGARALVVDLRGNSGGLLEPAVAVASRFAPRGPIVWREDGRGERHPYARQDRPLIEWPLVILVDGGTASAAEVLAAALRDLAGAPLVGGHTYGKGTVQYIHELSDGSGLHVTAARWVSPSGTRLDRGGLVPDVAPDASLGDAADPALDRALGLLS